jgi:short-subunit dehydrogenase
MRARRDGLIVNLGSMAPYVPIPFHGYLSASKAAVNTYSDTLRMDLKGLGIAVTTVEPGFVATHQGERFDALKVGRSIEDYACAERRATAVFEQGQRAGGNPQAVAAVIMRIIRTNKPARHYLVGKERAFVQLSRPLPAATVEAFFTRRFSAQREPEMIARQAAVD